MKIIYSVHQFFPKYYTGTERYVLNIASMMKKLGHNVTIVTYNPGPSTSDSIITDGLLISRYIYQNIQVISVKGLSESPYASFNLKNDVIKKWFKKLLIEEKPDLLHIAHPMRMTSVFWAANELGIKTILTLTDYWLLCGKGILLKNNNSPCLSPNEGFSCKKDCYHQLPVEELKARVSEARKIFKHCNALIASAQHLVDIFNYNKYDTSKLTMIRHGFNYFDNFTPLKSNNRGAFTIVSTGSLMPHKGVHILIEAFRKIQNDSMRLKIYGTSYGNDDYMKLLHNLAGSDKRISFNGSYTIDETAKLHQEADLVVQPSLWYETYPLVCVAALAYGVPIVVPDLTGAAEMVEPGVNGYIFKFGDPSSLATQIALAVKENLKQKSVITYPQSIESEAISTEEVYNTVLNN